MRQKLGSKVRNVREVAGTICRAGGSRRRDSSRSADAPCREAGMCAWVAPLVIDGALNGQLFRAYVEQQLAPQLSKGDILILDNLACHKVAGVRKALQRFGADVLNLPLYSSDFNPIERASSKLKRLLRSAAPRTVEALRNACSTELAKFQPDEFQNYLTNCG